MSDLMKRLSLQIFFVVVFLWIALSKSWSDIEGVATGWWSDNEGNNYYGDPPSEDSSYSSDSTYYGSSYGDAGARLGQAVSDMFQQIAEAERIARERRAQGLQLNSLGNQAFSAGDWDQAISNYEQAIEYFPSDQTILNNLRRARAYKINAEGVKYHDQKDWKNAVSFYKQALEMAPEDRTIRKNLTLAERMKGVEKEQALQEKFTQATREVQPMVEQIVGGLKPPSASAPPIQILDKQELPIEPFKWEEVDDSSLKASTKPLPGNAAGAGEHAQSAQRHANKIKQMLESPESEGLDLDPMAESLSEGAGLVFDTAGEYAGTLRKPDVKAEGMGVEEFKIPEERMNDATLAPLAEKWNQMDRDHRVVEDAYEKMKEKADKTPQDYVDMANAKAKLFQVEYEKKILKRDLEEKLAQPKPETPPASAPKPETKESEDKVKSKGQRIEMIE